MPNPICVNVNLAIDDDSGTQSPFMNLNNYIPALDLPVGVSLSDTWLDDMKKKIVSVLIQNTKKTKKSQAIIFFLLNSNFKEVIKSQMIYILWHI